MMLIMMIPLLVSVDTCAREEGELEAALETYVLSDAQCFQWDIYRKLALEPNLASNGRCCGSCCR